MKVKYVLVGFGGIAENRVAKEGYACDVKRFKALKNAQLVGADGESFVHQLRRLIGCLTASEHTKQRKR